MLRWLLGAIAKGAVGVVLENGWGNRRKRRGAARVLSTLVAAGFVVATLPNTLKLMPAGQVDSVKTLAAYGHWWFDCVTGHPRVMPGFEALASAEPEAAEEVEAEEEE